MAVQGTLVEDVVSERVDKTSDDGCSDADHDGKVDAAVVPVSPITIGSGTSKVTGTVYRFVSWRNETCQIVDLTKLAESVTDLQALTTTLASPTGTLTSLTGPGGSLSAAGGILGALNVLPIVNTLLTGTLTPLTATLTPMLAPLKALLAPLQQLLDVVNQTIDLCDLPKTVDLSSIKTLSAALSIVSGPINDLQAPVASLLSLRLSDLLSGVFTTVKNALATSVSSLDTALDAVGDDVQDGPAKIKSLAATATSAIQTLGAHPSTTHNTKRLTVAVWLNANANAGLRVPFYATSVVSDPKDGLL